MREGEGREEGGRRGREGKGRRRVKGGGRRRRETEEGKKEGLSDSRGSLKLW